MAQITPDLRARHQQISFGYDFSLLVSISYPDNPQNDVSYTYGRPERRQRAGLRVKTTDASGVLLDSYGKLGEITKEVRTLNTFVGFSRPTYTTQYTYDTFGLLPADGLPGRRAAHLPLRLGGLVDQVTGVKGPNTYTYVSRPNTTGSTRGRSSSTATTSAPPTPTTR